MDINKISVGEAAVHIPGVTKLFREHNIEFCCGGNQPLKEALENSPELKKSFLSLWEEGKDEDSIANAEIPILIDYILKNYHEKHRAELPEIIQLAERVEMRHADKKTSPKGLADHLKFMLREIELHMNKEEMVLFPILKSNPYARPVAPIDVMMHEHIEHSHSIDKVFNLTNNLVPPEEACTTWRALYSNLEHFVNELKDHISLENNALFKRALQEEKTESE